MPPKEKEKPKGWNLDPIETIVLLIFLSALATGLLATLRGAFSGGGEITFYGLSLSGIVRFILDHSLFFKILCYLIAGLAAIGAYVFNRKADAIWREEKKRLNLYLEPTSGVDYGEAEEIDPRKNKWLEIIKKSESENPSDWRLAIIEADIMLDDLLNQLQLPGDTMGEKLKAVDPPDFLTLDQAWEAHKARNMIAHQGDNFLIDKREVRRIISLYEAVFKEFRII